jgi:murein DD-endopeptidase MepM/ murein hydrolase activator NlpD
MFLRKPNLAKKDKAIQGALVFLLAVSRPLLWLGIVVGVLGRGAVEVRAGQAPTAGEVVGRGLPGPEAPNTLRRVTHRIEPGDTLSKLLARYGLPQQERQLWLRAIQKQLSLSAVRPGKEIQFYFSRLSLTGGKGAKEYLKALEIDLDADSTLAWEKGTKGIVFTKREKPYDVELKTAGGVVESSLFEDGARVGLNPSLLSQLADIFSWEIDFNREIRKGDTFRLLYEQRWRKGSESKASFRILAAELINSGRQYFAVFFEKEKGKGGYYDLDGRSLARAFLRFPLEFINITSTFSHSRFHPILKVDRPHHGVDFTAKLGTPVRAIGDGTILFAGWKRGGYGRMVEIQHDSVYSSRYAHLQRLAQGIRNGTKVQKGQVIGYVGSSGLSTGAHLHFEIYKDQEYTDPLNFEFLPEDTIEPALLRVFENRKRLFLAELAATPIS